MLISTLAPALFAGPPEELIAGGIMWDLVPFVLIAGVLILVRVLFLLRGQLVLLDELGERLEALDAIEELQDEVSAFAGARKPVDLRPVERALGQIREGQSRVEQALGRIADATRATHASLVDHEGLLQRTKGEELPVREITPAGPGLAERTIQRLISQGYERVQFVTEWAEFTEMIDGEILVEAWRDGAAHKGRVFVRNGIVQATELQPAYTLFP